MQIQITGKNFDVPQGVREYLMEKLGKLTRLDDRVTLAAVVLTDKASKDKAKACNVEIELHAPGVHPRANESKESFQVAVDSAIDKLQRQLRKVKTKQEGRRKGLPSVSAVVNAEIRSVNKTAAGPMVFVEKFNLKPMSTHDAISQLNGKKGKRDFYLFYNGSGALHCVYRRDDGNYGLLVPENEITES